MDYLPLEEFVVSDEMFLLLKKRYSVSVKTCISSNDIYEYKLQHDNAVFLETIEAFELIEKLYTKIKNNSLPSSYAEKSKYFHFLHSHEKFIQASNLAQRIEFIQCNGFYTLLINELYSLPGTYIDHSDQSINPKEQPLILRTNNKDIRFNEKTIEVLHSYLKENIEVVTEHRESNFTVYNLQACLVKEKLGHSISEFGNLKALFLLINLSCNVLAYPYESDFRNYILDCLNQFLDVFKHKDVLRYDVLLEHDGARGISFNCIFYFEEVTILNPENFIQEIKSSIEKVLFIRAVIGQSQLSPFRPIAPLSGQLKLKPTKYSKLVRSHIVTVQNWSSIFDEDSENIIDTDSLRNNDSSFNRYLFYFFGAQYYLRLNLSFLKKAVKKNFYYYDANGLAAKNGQIPLACSDAIIDKTKPIKKVHANSDAKVRNSNKSSMPKIDPAHSRRTTSLPDSDVEPDALGMAPVTSCSSKNIEKRFKNIARNSLNGSNSKSIGESSPSDTQNNVITLREVLNIIYKDRDFKDLNNQNKMFKFTKLYADQFKDRKRSKFSLLIFSYYLVFIEKYLQSPNKEIIKDSQVDISNLGQVSESINLWGAVFLCCADFYEATRTDSTLQILLENSSTLLNSIKLFDDLGSEQHRVFVDASSNDKVCFLNKPLTSNTLSTLNSFGTSIAKHAVRFPLFKKYAEDYKQLEDTVGNIEKRLAGLNLTDSSAVIRMQLFLGTLNDDISQVGQLSEIFSNFYRTICRRKIFMDNNFYIRRIDKKDEKYYVDVLIVLKNTTDLPYDDELKKAITATWDKQVRQRLTDKSVGDVSDENLNPQLLCIKVLSTFTPFSSEYIQLDKKTLRVKLSEIVMPFFFYETLLNSDLDFGSIDTQRITFSREPKEPKNQKSKKL